jgi:hypothetical protein
MKTIELSYEEGLVAAVQGIVQMMRAIRDGTVGCDHGGQSGRSLRERWAQAIQGQMAEHAISKFLDLYPVASKGGIHGDDPGGLAIRSTPWMNGHLIVNESELPEADTKKFVLVVGHWPTFGIVGWTYGRDAKRDEWWRPHERPASWWVPQSALYPVDAMKSTSECTHRDRVVCKQNTAGRTTLL